MTTNRRIIMKLNYLNLTADNPSQSTALNIKAPDASKRAVFRYVQRRSDHLTKRLRVVSSCVRLIGRQYRY